VSDRDAHLSLRIWHPTLTPHDISALIGQEAKITGVMGMPRGHAKGPNAAIWREHYWCHELEETSIEQCLARLVEIVKAREAAFEELARTGGRCGVYLFLAPRFGVGVVVDPSVLSLLGRANIALGIEAYRDPTIDH
jgi:hypothetical protein